MRKPHMMTGGRYPVLRSVAILSLVCAALAAAGAIISAVWVLAQLGDLTMWQRLGLACTIVGVGVLAVIAILVVAEVVELFIDMAHSLRVLSRRTEAPTTGAANEPAGSLDTLDDIPAELAIIRGR